MGQVSEFNIYHLMAIDDPAEYFSVEPHLSEGSGKCQEVDKRIGPSATKSSAQSTTTTSSKASSKEIVTNTAGSFVFQPDQLGALASVIRAKNAGPFEVTFDIMFSSPKAYNHVKSSGILNKSTIATLYYVNESDVVTAM